MTRLIVRALTIRRVSIPIRGAALVGENLPALIDGLSAVIASEDDMLAIQRSATVTAGLPIARTAIVSSLAADGGHHGQANAE
jgi:hypothetical protein